MEVIVCERPILMVMKNYEKSSILFQCLAPRVPHYTKAPCKGDATDLEWSSCSLNADMARTLVIRWDQFYP